MIKYKKIKKTVEEFESITCDICKQEFDKEDMETDEFTCIDYVGGYSSVFGDGSKIQLDICDKCLKEKLGTFVRIN